MGYKTYNYKTFPRFRISNFDLVLKVQRAIYSKTTEPRNNRSVTAIGTAILINIGEERNTLLIDCFFLYS